MKKIIVLIGVSGSGKSTLALDIASRENAIILNRDGLRQTLFGYTEEDIGAYYGRSDVGFLEELVTNIGEKIIREALRHNKSVVVDNTNLRAKYIKPFYKFGVEVELVLVEQDLKTCIQRDQQRVRSVGKDIIEKQWRDLENLKKTKYLNNEQQ